MAEITLRLGGKRLREALTNGISLVLVMDDGSEAVVVWADDNGNVIKGRPVLVSTGVRMKASGVLCGSAEVERNWRVGR